MNAIKDISGKRFGRLLVIRFDHFNRHRHSVWLCRCDCGKEVLVAKTGLNGLTRSCGCLKSEHARDMAPTALAASNAACRTHGLSKTRLERILHGMKGRCYNPKSPDFRYYGARGIGVCEVWRKDPAAFAAWAVGNGYAPGLTIDRINNDQGYEPTNCRWVPRSEQPKNRRNCRAVRETCR